MSRILVTGCAGFVASHLCDALVAAGHDVIGIDDLSVGKLENVNPKVQFIAADIRHGRLMKSVFAEYRPEYVYHLAALARIQPSIQDPSTSNAVNVTGTLNILEACRAYGVERIIFSASSSVYADTDGKMYEQSKTDPKNPYALQKLICEQYIQLYHRLYGLDYVMFRYFNVYGPRQILEGTYAAVVGIFLQQRREGKPLSINGDGSKRRDFTHVADITQANVMGLTLPTGLYNAGTGYNISIQELADAISPNQVHGPEAIGETRVTLADNHHLVNQGWQPTRSILDPAVIKEMDDAA